ncbi:uncharacterized protein LOC141903257 [Tubulanus polymorphus]|uniref:uncharacterized protein LOC141903257 n=1 Tax=Tubulanus polymorphus TaxID=672921 RepID=UPI003DA3A415
MATVVNEIINDDDFDDLFFDSDELVQIDTEILRESSGSGSTNSADSSTSQAQLTRDCDLNTRKHTYRNTIYLEKAMTEVINHRVFKFSSNGMAAVHYGKSIDKILTTNTSPSRLGINQWFTKIQDTLCSAIHLSTAKDLDKMWDDDPEVSHFFHTIDKDP